MAVVPVRLTVQNGPYAGVSRAQMLRRISAILLAAGAGDTELSVVLTGDKQVQRLNRIYRKIDRPTDVLAFSQREGPFAARAGLLLGDVVVSVPMAGRQAKASGRDLIFQLTMLVAHGILHLLGWDHDTPARDLRMRREVARLCLIAEKAPDQAKAPQRAPRP
jgi:probable rRNA maturation factor